MEKEWASARIPKKDVQEFLCIATFLRGWKSPRSITKPLAGNRASGPERRDNCHD